jgi:hypothetical protein
MNRNEFLYNKGILVGVNEKLKEYEGEDIASKRKI